MKRYFKILFVFLITINLYSKEKEIIFNNPKLSEVFANEYYISISDRLSAWRPVGKNLKAIVSVMIYNNGNFDYEIIKESESKEFNDILKKFLEEQKKIRYPIYKNRNVKINVDFKSEK
ncbi:TonB C-terminal domain-containing protein [Arcobacter aquimarinus]|uniref:TonB C-terminal domain-containing protein n=1 Tax=Arcobacter aquimarinus TaxID=1315211 RepID=A0AAE7E1F4_9BACT|nr:TonB C-terminal domain-containing protein [Arcobacter aquimarinus]QKE26064.1 hypothetical protein AAQM_1315 [Arcobacter aquimarinus]